MVQKATDSRFACDSGALPTSRWLHKGVHTHRPTDQRRATVGLSKHPQCDRGGRPIVCHISFEQEGRIGGLCTSHRTGSPVGDSSRAKKRVRTLLDPFIHSIFVKDAGDRPLLLGLARPSSGQRHVGAVGPVPCPRAMLKIYSSRIWPDHRLFMTSSSAWHTFRWRT